MKKFLISESEKQRILGMHKRAIRKEWVISEAPGDDDGQRMADANIRSISGYEMNPNDEPGNAMNIALNDINGNQLFYNCITDPRLSKKDVESSPTYSAGYLYDSNFKDVRNNTILSGEWEKIAKEHCSAKYSFVNQWRAENCPKLNAKTYWNYNYQCSSYINAQAAEKQQQAQATADAEAQKLKDAEAAKKAADDKAYEEKMAADAAASAAANKKALEALGNYPVDIQNAYQALADAIDKEGGTQADVEAKIDAINAVINNPNQHYKHYLYNSDIENVPKEGGKFQKAGGYKTYINRYMTRAKEKFPNLSKTVDVTNLTTATYPAEKTTTNENYYRDYFKKFIL